MGIPECWDETRVLPPSEIGQVVVFARRKGKEWYLAVLCAKDVTLLKCVSNYPADPEDMNLMTIPDMKARFGCRVGLSDHTLGVGVSITAASLGAKVIEKHFILSRKMKTPDSFFSIEPEELEDLVRSIRITEKALGAVFYGPTKGEVNSLMFRRSLFVTKDLKKGDLFSEDNIRSIRPSYGLMPKHYNKVLGKKALRDIKKGTPLNWDMIR